MNLLLWPWQRDEQPFFSDDENEWYIEKDMIRKELPDIIPFIVRRIETGEPSERVLMDRRTNEVIWTGTALEAMGVYMDIIHLHETFK